MQECSGAGRGKLRVYRQRGFEQKKTSARDGRDSGYDRKYLGRQHAKVFYAHLTLIVGSTNWSVVSEANRELSCVMNIASAAAHQVETIVGDLAEGAEEVSSN